MSKATVWRIVAVATCLPLPLGKSIKGRHVCCHEQEKSKGLENKLETFAGRKTGKRTRDKRTIKRGEKL